MRLRARVGGRCIKGLDGSRNRYVCSIVHMLAMKNLFAFGAFAAVAAAVSGEVKIRLNGSPTTKPAVDAVRNALFFAM
jgi:hypothetical protein